MELCGHEAFRSGFGLLRVNVGRMEMGRGLQSGHGGDDVGLRAIHVATGGSLFREVW